MLKTFEISVAETTFENPFLNWQTINNLIFEMPLFAFQNLKMSTF